MNQNEVVASAIRDVLVTRGQALDARPAELIRFTGNEDADTLLNDLANHPHAFVIACLMDRRVKAERAWLVPFRFQQRFGTFTFSDLMTLSRRQVLTLFVQTPSLHFMNEMMAGVFYEAIQRIHTEYSDNAGMLWADTPSSAAIVRRFLEFNGAGPKIATMAANILVRDYKVAVSDKFSIDISVDVQVRRTFKRLGLSGKDASDEVLIYRARELHPTYPGIFDLSLWEIGRNWCRPTNPICTACYMQKLCPSATRIA